MANTTWKQVVLDTADAYREANGTTNKIPVGQLADKVRAGAGTPYEGDNPLTIGQAGFTFPAKTLLKDGLQIINGVNGEDLTDTAADQTTAVEDLLRMVNRKIAMNNGEGQYVWKKCSNTLTLENPTIDLTNIDMCQWWKVSGIEGLDAVDASFFDGFVYGSYVFSYANGVLTCSNGSVTNTFTYDSATQELMGSTYNMFGDNKEAVTMTYTGTKVMNGQKGGFVDYVVSSDTEAYPNGGELDGYWYELVEEGVDLSEIGFTGIAYGTFTVADASTKLSEVEMVHNLGVVPKLVAVFVVSGDEPSSPTTYFREGVKYPSISTMCCINWSAPSSTSSKYNTGCSSTETTCHISNPTITGGKYYAKGCTYGWVIAG